jgi:hypothetical protein
LFRTFRNKNRRQDCKVGTMCGRILVGGRMKEGDEGEGIWWMELCCSPKGIKTGMLGMNKLWLVCNEI